MKGIKYTALLLPIFYITAVSASGGINPVSIKKDQNERGKTYEKVYVLEKDEDSGVIPTENFSEGGTEYEFYSLVTENNEKEDRRIHTEKQSISTNTNDVKKVIPNFPKTITAETEDGYSGVLECDYLSIEIEADGYVTSDYEVSEERTYPNLSDADISLVPKSITKNGNELALCDIAWSEQYSGEIDGQEIVKRYTAKATYKGTATKKTVKGYTATASYTGEVTKPNSEAVTYRVMFCEKQKLHKTEDKEDAEYMGGTEDNKSQTNPILWFVLACLVLMLPVLGYAIYRFIRRIRSGY